MCYDDKPYEPWDKNAIGWLSPLYCYAHRYQWRSAEQ